MARSLLEIDRKDIRDDPCLDPSLLFGIMFALSSGYWQSDLTPEGVGVYYCLRYNKRRFYALDKGWMMYLKKSACHAVTDRDGCTGNCDKTNIVCTYDVRPCYRENDLCCNVTRTARSGTNEWFPFGV